MRKKVIKQLGLVISGTDHPRARELEAMSQILDRLPRAVDLLHRELSKRKTMKTGRLAMTAEQVLRVMVIKQWFGGSYDDLAFQVADSNSVRAFCRFALGETAPARSTLQRNIKLIGASAWEKVNRLLVAHGCKEGVETGERTRTDCTVVETNIHEPTDSSLLNDCVRVLVRWMERAKQVRNVSFPDRRRRAKRRVFGILNAKSNEQRRSLYRDLLKITEETLVHAERVAEELHKVRTIREGKIALAIHQGIKGVLSVAKRVVDQTQRRVLCGESVPATEKIVSIFEPHTDIIIKDRRDTFYGHKICLTGGESGLVLDLVVEDGNPADSTLATKMVRRVAALFGNPPKQVTFDGGFASRANVEDIKAAGVTDVVFSKYRPLEIKDMAKDIQVFKKLRNFRAGIEASISFLKRIFGLDRCNWSGRESFAAYAWCSVVASNLVLLARRLS